MKMSQIVQTTMLPHHKEQKVGSQEKKKRKKRTVEDGKPCAGCHHPVVANGWPTKEEGKKVKEKCNDSCLGLF